MSEFYTIKSNARRAARKAGVNPETVYCVPQGWKFPGQAPKAEAASIPAAVPAGWGSRQRRRRY